MDYERLYAEGTSTKAALALGVLCERALTPFGGVHSHYYDGQEFFLLARLPNGQRAVHPVAFPSPESAALALVLLQPLLKRLLPIATKYEIVSPMPVHVM